MFLWESGYGPSAGYSAPKLSTSWWTLPVYESWEAELQPILEAKGEQTGPPQPRQLGCGHTSHLGQRVFLPRISFSTLACSEIDLTFLVYSSMNCNTGIDSCDHHHHPHNQEKWDRYKLFTMCQCPDTWASRGGQCPEAAATPAQGGLPLGVTLVTSSSPAFLSSNHFSEPASPAFSSIQEARICPPSKSLPRLSWTGFCLCVCFLQFVIPDEFRWVWGLGRESPQRAQGQREMGSLGISWREILLLGGPWGLVSWKVISGRQTLL